LVAPGAALTAIEMSHVMKAKAAGAGHDEFCVHAGSMIAE